MKRYRAYEGIPAPYDKRKRHVVPRRSAISDCNLTANSASLEGSPTRLAGNTSMSFPPWKPSGKSKRPFITRRSVPMWRSKPRLPLRLPPRSPLKRPSSINTASTASKTTSEYGEDDDEVHGYLYPNQ